MPPSEQDRGRPYHHGTLRVTLIEAGLRLLENRSVDELGLRELAREVGVSPTSVYRHFADKSALMSALADDAVSRLGANLRCARGNAAHTEAAWGAMSRVYLRFAQASPSLFRLMWASSASKHPIIESWGDIGSTGVLRFWSTTHGLATLVVGGQVRADQATLGHVLGAAAAGAQGQLTAFQESANCKACGSLLGAGELS